MFLCRQDQFYKGMTGITQVPKESMFSDLNNPNVVTTTSEEYSTSFGFTEDEVSAALDKFGLSDRKEQVKQWYEDKNYDSELTAREIGVERIKHYGFAFEGKKVLIME